MSFIDTPQFQRLRDLKQLGSAYYVFPGGSHNRFEHSIGVGHLSGSWARRLMETQPELGITPRSVQLVTLAGLCHDIGHGPYSHVFDNEFIPRVRPGIKFCHENMSVSMLDYLIEDNNIDIPKDEIRYVKSLIYSPSTSNSSNSKTHNNNDNNNNINSMTDNESFYYPGCLSDIVANYRNGIDVDKFDYMARDTYNLGIRTSFDFKRLMEYSRVIGNEICFNAKEVYNVYELFHTRYTLYKQIYLHRAGKAVEYMICDALTEADSVWNRRISSAIESPQEFMKLTDNLLKEIEFSTCSGLAKGREIVRNIRKRRLYRFVDEHIISGELSQSMKKVTPSDIATNNTNASINLSEDDIIVHDMKINYGSKDKNPVDATSFYRSSKLDKKFHIERKKVSFLVPSIFEERVIRVYSRNRNDKVIEAISRAFRTYIRRYDKDVTFKASDASRVWSSPKPSTSYTASNGSSMSLYNNVISNYNSSTAAHVLTPIPELHQPCNTTTDSIVNDTSLGDKITPPTKKRKFDMKEASK